MRKKPLSTLAKEGDCHIDGISCVEFAITGRMFCCRKAVSAHLLVRKLWLDRTCAGMALQDEEVSMAHLRVRGARRSRAAITAPDPSWNDLYRAGGISAALFVALIIVSLVLEFTTPR